MYLIYFHPKNERIKKRTELLRWYAREMSVIPEDWGVPAAISAYEYVRMLNNVSDIFSSQKRQNFKKNRAHKMIRARNVCNPSRLRSPSCQSQLLNLLGYWIMYLIYFHPKNERIIKRTELLRWYARAMSVIPEDWGVAAANLSLWICSDAE
jgi:hypothetical protein